MAHPDARGDDDLRRAVEAFQELHLRLSIERDIALVQSWHQERHARAVGIYGMLKADLERVARGWAHSNIAADVESLTLNLFACIFIALPSVRIDDEKNLRGLLLTIARRGAYDQHRRDQAGSRSREVGRFISLDACDAERPWLAANPQSHDAEDRWIRAIEGRQLARTIREHWKSTLSDVDWRIVVLRLQDTSYRDIVREIGGELTEAGARKRFQRIVERTREYLHVRGLLDDDI